MSEKKRIIYHNVQHENPHPNLIAYGLFAIFQNPQIAKREKDMVKFQFFLKKLVKSGQTTYSRSITGTK